MRVFWQLVFVPLILIALSNPVTAQSPTPTVSFTATEVGDFASFLRAAQQKTGASFLVEDAPLHLTLSAEVRKKLIADLRTQTGAKAQVATIADVYDFDVIPVSPGLFVWRKRYSEAQDIPNVSFAEARDSIHTLFALFQSFSNPALGEEERLFYSNQQEYVLHLLSPQQLERAKEPTGIPVRELPSTQKDELFRLMMDSYTHLPRILVGTADYNVEKVYKNQAQFGYATLPKQPATKKPAAESLVYFFPFRDIARVGTRRLSKEPFVAPVAEDEAVRARLLPLFRTLPAFLEPLSLLPPGDTSSQNATRVLLRTEPELAERTLLFVGEYPKTGLDATLWVSGVASAFGWQTKTIPDAGHTQIEQSVVEVRCVPAQQLRSHTQINKLKTVIASSIPEPILRWMLLEQTDNIRAKKQQLTSPFTFTARSQAEVNAQAKKQQDERNAGWQQLISMSQAFMERPPLLGRASSLRFRDSLYQRLNASLPPQEQVSASALSDREKALFALSEMAQYLDVLGSWISKSQAHVTRFNEQYLVYRLDEGSEDTGDKKLYFMISGYDPEQFGDEFTSLFAF